MNRTATRCAADMEDVGWPEPAAVVDRMLSIASCAASSFHRCVRSSMSLSIAPSVAPWVRFFGVGAGAETTGPADRTPFPAVGSCEEHA